MRISDWSSDVCSSDLVLALAFFLDDDLGQHRAGDVLARLRVVDDEILPVLHHLAQMVEGDVAARRRVVQPPVGVFLDRDRRAVAGLARSEEHTSELQSLMRISYAVFCLKKKKKT